MHISLDIETWGTRPGCDIRSIGAVVFNPYTDDAIGAGDKPGLFYVATRNPKILPNNGEQRRYNLHRDPATVEWWNNQTSKAQAAFANPVDLKEGLRSFGLWLYTLDPADEMHIWTKGPHFDIAILGAAYHAVGFTELPWHYRAPRDLRTIVYAAGMARADECTYGEPHNALDDAIGQAMTICKAYEKLGLRK